VSPKELASLHPRLYHITRPHALNNIKTHGLLSTAELLNLFEVSSEQRKFLGSTRRPNNVVIDHPTYGRATLTDNTPLSDTALLKCLDDGLRPPDWMRMLNERVFFWVDEKNLESHFAASIRDGNERVVMAFDTLSLVGSCYRQVELAAINTGSTIRRPARRGIKTFAPAHLYTYPEWQQLRGGKDRIKELTVRGGVRNIDTHLVGHYTFTR